MMADNTNQHNIDNNISRDISAPNSSSPPIYLHNDNLNIKDASDALIDKKRMVCANRTENILFLVNIFILYPFFFFAMFYSVTHYRSSDHFRSLRNYGYYSSPIDEVVVSKDSTCGTHMSLQLTRISNLNPLAPDSYLFSTNRWKGALLCVSYSSRGELVSKDGTCPDDYVSCNGFCFREKCPLTSISVTNIDVSQFSDSSSQFAYEGQYYQLDSTVATDELIPGASFINRIAVNSQIYTDPYIIQEGIGICQTTINGVRTEPVDENMNINRFCNGHNNGYNPQYIPIDSLSTSSLSPTTTLNPEEAFLHSSFPDDQDIYDSFKDYTHPDAVPTLYTGHEYPLNMKNCISAQADMFNLVYNFGTNSDSDYLREVPIYLCFIIDCVIITVLLLAFLVGNIVRCAQTSNNKKVSGDNTALFVAHQQRSREKCSVFHFFRFLNLSILPHLFGFTAIAITLVYVLPNFHAANKLANSGCFEGQFADAIESLKVYQKYRVFIALLISAIALRAIFAILYFVIYCNRSLFTQREVCCCGGRQYSPVEYDTDIVSYPGSQPQPQPQLQPQQPYQPQQSHQSHPQLVSNNPNGHISSGVNLV